MNSLRKQINELHPYRIEQALNARDLEKRVAIRIKEGYRVTGGLVKDGSWFMQAVTLKRGKK